MCICMMWAPLRYMKLVSIPLDISVFNWSKASITSLHEEDGIVMKMSRTKSLMAMSYFLNLSDIAVFQFKKMMSTSTIPEKQGGVSVMSTSTVSEKQGGGCVELVCY